MQIDADASMKMEDEGRRIRRGNTPHLPSTEKTRKKTNKKNTERKQEEISMKLTQQCVLIHFHPIQQWNRVEENRIVK